MSDDKPELTTQADKEKIEAETDLIKARTELLKAELAHVQTSIGSVAGSSIAGTVEAEQGAGAIEASVLVARLINDAVSQIKEQLLKSAPSDHYILFTGADRPDFGEWGLFQVLRSRIVGEYDRADEFRSMAEELLASGGSVPLSEDVSQTERELAALAVTGLGAALDMASKVGSYFQSDYKVAPVTLSGIDADLVAVTLAGLLGNAVYPARWPLPVSDDLVEALLKEPMKRRQAAKEHSKSVEEARRKAETAAAKGGDATTKARLEAGAVRLAQAAEAYAEADKAFDALLESLAAETNGTPRIALIAEQKAIVDALKAGYIAVLLIVGGVAGTTYTKRNLWTFFGGMPFFVSGGAVVSFLAVGDGGVMKTGGQIPLHSGFHKIGRVPLWIADRVR